MIENLFTFVRTLGNQRIQGKKFFVTQVGLLGTVSDNSGSIGTAGKVLSSTGSGVSWITVGTGSSDVATLNDLTDVVISTASEGNLLRFNGTSWVNWAPNFLTGYGSLNDLSDVTLTLPVNGSRLVYVSSTGQWIDAAPLAVNKIYYGTAVGDAATTTVITNGTRLGVGSLAMPTNLTVGQVEISAGLIGEGSIHIGGVNDADIYLLASKNKIQTGSQVTVFIPDEGEGEGGEGTTTTTFTPSTLNIQPLGGDTVFGAYTTATGYKTPAGNRQELLTAAGTKTLTNSASNGQILRWIQPVGGVGNWQADDENSASTPNLDAVTDVGSTTTNSITVGGLSTSGTVTAAVVTTPLIEREGVLTINSEEQVDQGEPNPNLLYVSWLGDNKFVINADGYAIADTGYKVVGGTASGFLKANGTIDTSTYLTSYTETQTLDAVTDLGSTTTNNISVGGLTSTSVSTPILQSNSGILIIDADVNGGIQPQQGDPAEPILSFDWQGTTQGYIDTDGKITFNGFKTPTGTASGFLKANGTVDTSVYLTAMGNLDDIGDVVLTDAAGGDVLMFDGEDWINSPLPDYVSKVQHEVKAGVAITAGQAVYVTSANGTNMIVGLASNTTEATSSKTMGLALSTAAINGHLFVVTEGLIDGLDTSTATAGDPVWLGVNGALIFGLTNKPIAPAHLVYIGVVTRSNNRNGEIFVHTQNGFELNEIHDVLINGVITGQLIRRDADGLWKNWTPNFLTENSVNVLTNKRINLSTSISSIVPIDGVDQFLGQTDIILYQDGVDKGGRINVASEGAISISNPGIGYYTGSVTATPQGSGMGEVFLEGPETTSTYRFYVTVSGNTLTGTVAEFNEAITDGNLVTEAYVQSQIANLVDSAPSTLDTLNELAAALGDDANFATTVTTSIATKQPQLNGTGFVKASGTTISYDNSTYITSESDPVFTSSAAYEITGENLSEWGQAYRWGDHSTFGYLTSLPAHNHSASEITSGTLSTNRLPQQELGVSIVGNFGQWQVHSSYTNFNTPVSYWGWNYVQGNTNAPHQTSSQWYRGRFSLGSEYGFGSDGGDYWMEIAIPRYNQDNNAGNLFVRTAEDGVPTAWQGVRGAYATNAGYAISSGNSETTDQTNFTALSINDSPVATEEFVASQGYLTTLPAHNHDDRYYTETESDSRYINASGDTMSGSLSFDPAAVIKKRITLSGFNPVKTSSGVLTSISDNGSGYTYYVIETNVPQDEYQMGGFTIELLGRYGETNNKTKIDLGGYWNPEGNGGFTGFEAHGTNPQYKPTIEVCRNINGNTAFIIYGVAWAYPVIVARDLWLGYNDTDGSQYGEGWKITGTNDVSSYTNNDTVIWRNAYSDSNPAGYITGSYLPLSGGTLTGNLTFSTQGSKITFGDSSSTNPCMIGEGLVNTEGTDSDFLTIYARSSLRIYSTITTERARFDINGLTVNGTITEQSSIRYKKDVVGIESTSDRVELLKPVRYKKIENDAEEIGLIAEDVAELFPEVVKYDNEGRPDGVNYSRLSVILLKAVQELTERVNKLENK